MHNIIIKRVTNGVIVTIGCHTFVHNNITFVLQEIGDYLKNPATTMKRWEPTLKSWYKIQEESEDAPSLRRNRKMLLPLNKLKRAMKPTVSQRDVFTSDLNFKRKQRDYPISQDLILPEGIASSTSPMTSVVTANTRLRITVTDLIRMMVILAGANIASVVIQACCSNRVMSRETTPRADDILTGSLRR
jgi:hypothetical protein